MNKILPLLAIFLFAQSAFCQSNKVCLYEDLEYIQKSNESVGKFYIKGSKVPFTGTAYDNCEKGKYIFHTKEFKNGLADGKDKSRYYGGQTEFLFYYKKGKLIGEGKKYDREGNVIFHAKFNKGDTVQVYVNNLESKEPVRGKVSRNDSVLKFNVQSVNGFFKIDILNAGRYMVFIDTADVAYSVLEGKLYVTNICDTVTLDPCREDNLSILKLRRLSPDSIITLNHIANTGNFKEVCFDLLFSVESWKNPMSKYINSDHHFWTAYSAFISSSTNSYTRKREKIKF